MAGASFAQPGSVPPPTIAGDWAGTLSAGGAELHLVLHIQSAADGTLSATLDSVDQGANGIPVSAIALDKAKLSLTVAAVHGSYEGTLNPGATEIKGTWTQGAPLPLDFKRKPPASAGASHVTPSDIDGTWAGTLDTSGTKLRIVFHLATAEAGLTATMDSPDQGAKGIPMSSAVRQGNSLKLELKQAAASFEGKISKDLGTITGSWSQGGQALPLEVKAVKDKASLDKAEGERIRPQNPVKPYPYNSEDVSYQNKLQGDTLAATLTTPPGKGPFPAVLLITGSGPQDRDESLLGHKPFLVLSDYLTRHGIVVLRADDRGTGKSTGDFAAATTADFATDAEAGLVYLKSRPEVDQHRVGLIGHSEGGIIAPMVAARNPGVNFIVLMAGTGVRGDLLITEQGKLIEESMGTQKATAEANAAQRKALFDLIVNHSSASQPGADQPDMAALKTALREKLKGMENASSSHAEAQAGAHADGQAGSPADAPVAAKTDTHTDTTIATNFDAHNETQTDVQLDAQVAQLTSPWFRYFLAYDPAPALRQVRCPVLALNGSLDLQVPPAQNLPAIRHALAQGGNKSVDIEELPGLNHLFQTAKTGSPTEYAAIDETISPAALATITSWILLR